MDQRIARNALGLLERVQVTGQEAMVWVEVADALRKIVAPEPAKRQLPDLPPLEGAGVDPLPEGMHAEES